MTPRVRTALVWGLAALGFANVAAAESIWVVPRTTADDPLARYLSRALPDATVRERLDPIHSGVAGSILRVDLRRGVLEAVRSGEEIILRRSFEPAVARQSPYAIAVAAAELLELPEIPLPPPEPPPEPSVRDGNPSSASGEADVERSAAVERADSERRAEESEPDERARVPVEDPDEEDRSAVTELPAPESEEEAEPEEGPSPGLTFSRKSTDFSFVAGLGYALLVAPSPATVFHRPYGEIAVAFGDRSLRGYAGAAAELFGQTTVDGSAAQVTLRRNEVLGVLGVLVELSEGWFLDGRATAGLAFQSTDVDAADAEVPDDRAAFVFGFGVGLRTALYRGLQLAIGVDLGIDEGARRYLVQGEPVARDGPFFTRIRAGLMWDTR